MEGSVWGIMGLPTGSKSEDEVTKLLAEKERKDELSKKPSPFDASVDSMGMIDDTVDFMDKVMRGVAYGEFSVPGASVAGRCSDQIYKLMRLKWEVIQSLRKAESL